MRNPLTILFATMTGNAEECALRIAGQVAIHGYDVAVHNLATYSAERLSSERQVLLVVSTWGEGEPPDDAIDFWDGMNALPPGSLEGLRFAVYALGDTAYDEFCGFGRNCDQLLESLGANRITPRVDCDVDWGEPLAAWIDGLVAALRGTTAPIPS